MKTKQLFQWLALVIGITSAGSAHAQCQAGFTFSVNAAAATFTNTSSGAPALVNYMWDFGDGNVDYTANPAPHTYQYAGSYNVCLFMSDSMPNTCSSTFCDSVIIVNAPPPPPLPCNAAFYQWNDSNQANLVHFQNASSPGPTSNWSWSFGDGNTSTLQNPVNQYTAAGTYWVCLSITDANANTCSHCDSIYVGVPNCQASFTHYVVSAMDSVIFTNTTTGVSTSTIYSWNFGDGNQATGQNATHVYQYNGTYTVCLSLTDNLTNCYSVFCDTVSIYGAANPPCSASFTWWPDSANPNAAYFLDQSSLNPITWAWDFGDQGTSTAQHPAHVYAQSGTYTVCLTVMLSDSTTCSYCSTVSVGNFFGCSATLTFVQDTANTLHYWGYATVTGTAPFTYFWDFGDNSTSTLQYPSHTYASAGHYLVCLTTTDANGCNATSCDSVLKTHGLMNVQMLDIVNPNALSVGEITNGIESMYPNPASNDLTVTIDAKQLGADLMLIDELGRTVFTSKADQKKNHVDVSSLPAGIYSVMLRSETQVSRGRILIAR